MDGLTSGTIEWGLASQKMPGETISGDLHLVKPTDKGVLVAVADGLGHGSEAAEAARLAIDAVGDSAQGPLAQVLEHCSQQLRLTRGVVISLAFLNAFDGTMEWLGVGNVEGLLVRSQSSGNCAIEALMLSQGVVGARLPRLRSTHVDVSPGDTLVFATDGIRRGFEEQVHLPGVPGEIARDILERYWLGTDDALVLVATYKGKQR
jgi:phosphoserine phosphatase RsbX